MVFRKKYSLENSRFGKLTVLRYLGSKKYLCKCDCGNEKSFYTHNLKSGRSKSCGCISSINRKEYNEEIKNKIISSVFITEKGCWEWQKSKHRQGYGNLCYKSKNYLAHRISWMLFKGELDPDILVCHHCDNPCCVNPEHLFLGTDKDNTQDYLKKNRGNKAFGERSGAAKVKENEVKEIREMRQNKFTYKIIAEKYGVSAHTIRQMCKRITWKHVE